jgi:aminopeptidase N
MTMRRPHDRAAARHHGAAGLLALASLVGACAPAGPPPAPARAPAAGPPTASAAAAGTAVADAAPPFRPLPLVQWGPLPAGTPHQPRARSYDLQHQIVRVRFDWARHAVVGSTTVRLGALDTAITEVALDAVGMTIAGVRSAAGATLGHRYDGRALVVALPAPLRPGARTTLAVDYESVRPKKGAYFVDRRHVVWTQGETEDTRYWVPTYDGPNDKTTWEIYVRTGRGEKALSNGRLADSRPVGGEVEWHWVQDRPASTYLMTVVTGDFVVLQDKWRDLPVGYWTYPDSVQAAWRGFGKTPHMVDLFSARTGVVYPWAKYDQVTAPDYIFGGMENVTATTQADDDILHPEWAEPQANADDLVSHELGHQWYGDLVTTLDWSNVWLNEGFATFLEQIFHEHDKGSDDGALYRLQAQEATIAADSAARRPLVYDRWVTDPLELFFSGHIYPKGATVLQMLRHQLGESPFWAAVNGYTVEHAYGNVVTADLERAFQGTAGRDLSRFFRQWVYGAGFPAFRVSYAYDTAHRELRLAAEQLQPRDSLTGYFETPVDVEVLTDSGPVRLVVQVRDSVTPVVIPLRAPPRSIRWDKGGWLLDVTDFPRPTTMLAYQLAHDDDAIGRVEAAELLGERSGDPAALTAVARAARYDRAWGVRARAAAVLARFADGGAAAEAVDALLASSRDDDARVREQAARSLGRFARAAGVPERLRELATADPSLYVRGAALAADAAVAGSGALPTITRALARDSWLDLERRQGVTALQGVGAADGWALAKAYLAPGTSRETRRAAIATLLLFARADSARGGELAAALALLLDADDLFIRQSAAAALGELGQPTSVGALEARRAVEAESRVINEIDAALRALRGRAGGT